MRRTLTIAAPALIDVIIERFRNSGFNTRITMYFELQYSYLLDVIPTDLIVCLPAEDQFFIDLFDKVLLPGARKKVCFQRQQIRMGLTGVDAAKESIPRIDLRLATAKQKYQHTAIGKTTINDNKNG